MNLSQLADAGRCPTLPCRIELADGDALTIEAWLRTLPGQRYVGRARWNDRQVLAKLMVGDKRGGTSSGSVTVRGCLSGRACRRRAYSPRVGRTKRVAGCCSNTWKMLAASGTPGVKSSARCRFARHSKRYSPKR